MRETGAHERIGWQRETEKPLITLALNLTVMQTTIAKRVKLVITKVTNGKLAIMCLIVFPSIMMAFSSLRESSPIMAREGRREKTREWFLLRVALA